MKTQFYHATQCLSIKKFQQHDFVLELSNKMCFINISTFDDIIKFKFCFLEPYSNTKADLRRKNRKL